MSTFQERGASQNIVVEVPEREVVPRETARFPFSVRGGERSYSIHEFSVSSDNPNFNPRWAHIVKETDGMRSPAVYPGDPSREHQPRAVRHLSDLDPL